MFREKLDELVAQASVLKLYPFAQVVSLKAGKASLANASC